MQQTLGVNLSSVDTTAKHVLGSHFQDEDGKIYKYVVYAEGSGALDLAVGDFVVYTDESSTEVTADVSDITADEIGAGATPVAVTVDGTYFWVQIKGPATLSTTLGGSAADGDPLTAVGAADKAVTLAAESDTAAQYKQVVGVAIDASAKTVFLDCPY